MDNLNHEQENMETVEDLEAAEKRELGRKLSTVGWALFFIWIGIAFLAEFSIPVGLLGVGIITLAMQVWRVISQLKLEWFWVVVGALFTIGGIWDLAEPEIPLIPMLLIIAGVLLLLSVTISKRRRT
ncbi:hypothetical protein ACFLQW_01835 [Candidatus Zixiibacteriota bacterium]